MSSNDQSHQKPGQQHPNRQQKGAQPTKPQGGHQPKPGYSAPSDRMPNQSNVGKK
jgi:hypothetical protein